MSFPVRNRYIAAFAAGLLVYLTVLYRFLSYSQRNMLPGSNYLTFAGLMLAIGFFLTLGVTKSRYRIVTFVLAGVCVAHMVVIKLDWRKDPSSHNLLPFEFVFLCIYAAPAYVGATIAQLVGHFRGRRDENRQLKSK